MSIRTCTMTIKGDGKGGYGKFVHDATRTVEGFIIDNKCVYGKVLNHVKECQDPDPCDPLEVVRIHLDRLQPKRMGIVSDSLLRNVLRYKKVFRDRIPDEVVREAATRPIGMACFNARQVHFKSGDDVLDMFTFVYGNSILKDDNSFRQFLIPSGPLVGPWAGLMNSLIRFGRENFPKPLPPREELVKLVTVMEVLAA